MSITELFDIWHFVSICRIYILNTMNHCLPEQCDSGQCCCSMHMDIVSGEEHQATVWKGGEKVQSTTININESCKLKVLLYKNSQKCSRFPEIHFVKSRSVVRGWNKGVNQVVKVIKVS